jgi:hypothetical protein
MALFQVTTLTTSAVKTILVPGPNVKAIIISNIGANAINMTIDGGSTFTDNVTNQKTGTDPTTGATGLGIPLAAGGQYSITTIPGGAGLIKPIRAIMQTSTTTLNISTDDTESTSPLT